MSNETNVSGSYLLIDSHTPIPYAVILYGYIMPFLLVTTIIVNTLIVIVLSKRHMRTPTNVVLMAMALCDMFTLLVPSPWFIYLFTFGHWSKPIFPTSMCYAYNVMQEIIPNMFHTSSIWLTLALAVQRYIYVCHAPLARKFCTLANVYKCLGYILFFAFFHQAVELCSRKYSPKEYSVENTTTEACWETREEWFRSWETTYYLSYYSFRIVFVHVIPCVTLVILNMLLFRALKQAQKRRDILLSKKNQKTECKKLRDSNCTTLMLIVVVSVFLFVEVPLGVVVILHVISNTTSLDILNYQVANTLILFTNFFIMLSYPINFAIYCGMSRQFRETFKDLFIRGGVSARNGSSRYSIVNGPRTCTNETVL